MKADALLTLKEVSADEDGLSGMSHLRNVRMEQ